MTVGDIFFGLVGGTPGCRGISHCTSLFMFICLHLVHALFASQPANCEYALLCGVCMLLNVMLQASTDHAAVLRSEQLSAVWSEACSWTSYGKAWQLAGIFWLANDSRNDSVTDIFHTVLMNLHHWCLTCSTTGSLLWLWWSYVSDMCLQWIHYKQLF